MPGATRQSHWPDVCHVSKRLGNAVLDGDSKNLLNVGNTTFRFFHCQTAHSGADNISAQSGTKNSFCTFTFYKMAPRNRIHISNELVFNQYYLKMTYIM